MPRVCVQEPGTHACLTAVASLLDLGMIDPVDAVQLCSRIAPLTLHPSAWIREGAIRVGALPLPAAAACVRVLLLCLSVSCVALLCSTCMAS